jgi:hypothetical protein
MALRIHRLHDKNGRAICVRSAAGIFLGLSTLAVATIASPAFANTSPYELYCPGSPVGNLVLNGVVTSGTISPADPAPGTPFHVTGYQTTLTLPNSIVSAAAALGNTDIAGTATTRIDANGATPSSIAHGTMAFDVPIPMSIPDQGLTIDLPPSATTLGPLTASSTDMTISVGGPTTLTLNVSGSSLALNCIAYPNDSATTGIVRGRPRAKPALPVIARLTRPLVITTTSLPGGSAGHAYTTTLAATGGNPPYRWRVAAGRLPGGLRLHKTTGTITGTPRKGDSTSSTFTIEVFNQKSPTGSPTQAAGTRQLSITI